MAFKDGNILSLTFAPLAIGNGEKNKMSRSCDTTLPTGKYHAARRACSSVSLLRRP
jgi:hypothetical protein